MALLFVNFGKWNNNLLTFSICLSFTEDEVKKKVRNLSVLCIFQYIKLCTDLYVSIRLHLQWLSTVKTKDRKPKPCQRNDNDWETKHEIKGKPGTSRICAQQIPYKLMALPHLRVPFA